MSAGVCGVCLGAGPAFTGGLGQRAEGRVIAVHMVDVHGNPRHVVFCDSCTKLIVAAWSRMGRRALGRAALKVSGDVIKCCAVCDQCYTGEHACPGAHDG